MFILRDKKDAEGDGEIAQHVLKMHQYRDPNEQEGEVRNDS